MNKADEVQERIMIKILGHLRNEMQVWPKEADIKDLERLIKSILSRYTITPKIKVIS